MEPRCKYSTRDSKVPAQVQCEVEPLGFPRPSHALHSASMHVTFVTSLRLPLYEPYEYNSRDTQTSICATPALHVGNLLGNHMVVSSMRDIIFTPMPGIRDARLS